MPRRVPRGPHGARQQCKPSRIGLGRTIRTVVNKSKDGPTMEGRAKVRIGLRCTQAMESAKEAEAVGMGQWDPLHRKMRSTPCEWKPYKPQRLPGVVPQHRQRRRQPYFHSSMPPTPPEPHPQLEAPKPWIWTHQCRQLDSDCGKRVWPRSGLGGGSEWGRSPQAPSPWQPR